MSPSASPTIDSAIENLRSYLHANSAVPDALRVTITLDGLVPRTAAPAPAAPGPVPGAAPIPAPGAAPNPAPGAAPNPALCCDRDHDHDAGAAAQAEPAGTSGADAQEAELASLADQLLRALTDPSVVCANSRQVGTTQQRPTNKKNSNQTIQNKQTKTNKNKQKTDEKNNRKKTEIMIALLGGREHGTVRRDARQRRHVLAGRRYGRGRHIHVRSSVFALSLSLPLPRSLSLTCWRAQTSCFPLLFRRLASVAASLRRPRSHLPSRMYVLVGDRLPRYACKYSTKEVTKIELSASVLIDAHKHIHKYPSKAEDTGAASRYAK